MACEGCRALAVVDHPDLDEFDGECPDFPAPPTESEEEIPPPYDLLALAVGMHLTYWDTARPGFVTSPWQLVAGHTQHLLGSADLSQATVVSVDLVS